MAKRKKKSKKSFFFILIIVLLLLLSMSFLYHKNSSVIDIFPLVTGRPQEISGTSAGTGNITGTVTKSATTPDTLKLGAFNLQIFGTTKAGKPEVMEILSKIIRNYDVIAVQEIRDASQTALPALRDIVNSNGANYDFVVSDRLGRTTSKEQYAYLYNTQTMLV